MAERGTGVVVCQGEELLGFLCAYYIDSWRGLNTAHSPEWAHGATGCDMTRTFNLAYRAASARWTEQGCQAHLFTTLAHDRSLLDLLQWQGLGVVVADALRDLSPVGAPEVPVRRAVPEDLRELEALGRGLVDHLSAPTTFLTYPYRSEAYWRGQLADETVYYAVAEVEGVLAAYMKLGPCDDDVCRTVQDVKTMSISGAFCMPERRSGGIARALLNHGIAWARECGFKRCGVDWESSNIEASAFWLRHFRPVCLSLRRVLP
jgi:GNAT superfamily N-acetyltransferase